MGARERGRRECDGAYAHPCGEALGSLVAPPVFKTEVSEYLGQAGSIPVRLRQPTLTVADCTVARNPAGAGTARCMRPAAGAVAGPWSATLRRVVGSAAVR